MQSTKIVLAERLGSLPAQGLRRRQNPALSSCPSSGPSSPAPRLEGVSPLAWPQHKGKDQVPCLGAQTWVGVWGEVGQEGPQLPGLHPRASSSSPPEQGPPPWAVQLPEVQPGPLALCGCSGHPRRHFPAGCWSGLFQGP